MHILGQNFQLCRQFFSTKSKNHYPDDMFSNAEFYGDDDNTNRHVIWRYLIVDIHVNTEACYWQSKYFEL